MVAHEAIPLATERRRPAALLGSGHARDAMHATSQERARWISRTCASLDARASGCRTLPSGCRTARPAAGHSRLECSDELDERLVDRADLADLVDAIPAAHLRDLLAFDESIGVENLDGVQGAVLDANLGMEPIRLQQEFHGSDKSEIISSA